MCTRVSREWVEELPHGWEVLHVPSTVVWDESRPYYDLGCSLYPVPDPPPKPPPRAVIPVFKELCLLKPLPLHNGRDPPFCQVTSQYCNMNKHSFPNTFPQGGSISSPG